jgi:hypothetical protein
LEVPVQVTLVGEASGGGGLGDPSAGFEQAPGGANAVGDLQGVGRQAGALAEEAGEAELADAGGSSELVEAHVALGPIAQVVAGHAERPVVARAERRPRCAHRRGVLDQGAHPLCQALVPLERLRWNASWGV